MSKTLILARHAKSDWSEANTADIDRPLNARGPKDARLIGSWLHDYFAENNIRQLHTVCSPATRAESTCNILLSCLHSIDSAAVSDDDLYMASSDEILDLARNHTGSEQALMLVGHNPGMHEAVELLIGAELNKFPTCAIACIEFDIDNWQELVPGGCKSWIMMRPKLLRPQKQVQD